MIASPEAAPQINQEALLNDFVSGRGTLTELAADHGMSLIDLIVWYEDDATQDLLKAIETMSARRAAILAHSYSPGALATLAYMLDNPSLSLVERCSVATQILRQAPHAGTDALTAPAHSDSPFEPNADNPATTASDASAPDQQTLEEESEPTRNFVAGRRAEPRETISHAAHARPRRDRNPQSTPSEAERPEAPASPMPNPPADAD